ncbi:hypothetical protein PGTUg99_019572 [Puccinia graminis f. sp. tritici]|uniref:Uncharacterized protein n=1 Tax=Puccinia graminis f. sp. tritici TaxID=56615 RepID=A0A5B0RZK0_PUCGR|nr:hypothetical protein PGTUg99_019572 [Puccinia graminis f. sp. tritici]
MPTTANLVSHLSLNVSIDVFLLILSCYVARGGGPTGPGNRASPHIPTVGTAQLNGQPGVGVVGQWPPNFVTFDSSEAHLDTNYYDYLAQTYDLCAPYMDFAEDIVQVRTYSVD